MADPVLHLIAGPNGAGKSTLYEKVIEPATNLPFVNPDVIALEHWPEDAAARSYEAAALAAERRNELVCKRASFVAEVFSHRSKLDLAATAIDAGYLVTLHVVAVPEGLAVARVASRVAAGGHAVPEDKIHQRYRRLWPLVVEAIGVVENAFVYDNTRAARPFRVIARFQRGSLAGQADWPPWTPKALRSAAD